MALFQLALGGPLGRRQAAPVPAPPLSPRCCHRVCSLPAPCAWPLYLVSGAGVLCSHRSSLVLRAPSCFFVVVSGKGDDTTTKNQPGALGGRPCACASLVSPLRPALVSSPVCLVRCAFPPCPGSRAFLAVGRLPSWFRSPHSLVGGCLGVVARVVRLAAPLAGLAFLVASAAAVFAAFRSRLASAVVGRSSARVPPLAPPAPLGHLPIPLDFEALPPYVALERTRTDGRHQTD